MGNMVVTNMVWAVRKWPHLWPHLWPL